MKPAFRILANKKDVTERLEKRLISLQIEDEAGFQSDRVEIRLDDKDGEIDLNDLTGAELEVSIGFAKTGLYDKGIYTVDELTLQGPPSTMVIVAKAANMKASLKAPKSRNWDDVTFASLVASIAAEHGLKPGVSSSLADIAFEHLDQTDESDLHFLTRLARLYDATAKPAGGALLLAKKGETKSVTGKQLEPLALQKEDVGSWRMTVDERNRFQAVIAKWHNKDTAQTISVQAGEGNPAFSIRQTFSNEAQARAAATSKLDQLKRGKGKLSLTGVTKPEAIAEAILNLSGLRQGVNGDWLMTRVVHKLDGSGYSCSIDAETPGS